MTLGLFLLNLLDNCRRGVGWDSLWMCHLANLLMGLRRPYLVSMGVDAGRLTVISYGKERPIAVGSSEESWARNRRAVTISID